MRTRFSGNGFSSCRLSSNRKVGQSPWREVAACGPGGTEWGPWEEEWEGVEGLNVGEGHEGG